MTESNNPKTDKAVEAEKTEVKTEQPKERSVVIGPASVVATRTRKSATGEK